MMSSKSTHPALYRVSQFFSAVQASLPSWAGGARGGLPANEKILVTTLLPQASQQQLFELMPSGDQRHAVAVAQTLRQAGYDEPALLQAALLHDVGKGLGQPIVHRVLIVLFEAFWPEALAKLSTVSTDVIAVSWWRRPFVVHAQHPAIGAAWAQDAGCSMLTVRLIARHQDTEGDTSNQEQKLLAALQWADGIN